MKILLGNQSAKKLLITRTIQVSDFKKIINTILSQNNGLEIIVILQNSIKDNCEELNNYQHHVLKDGYFQYKDLTKKEIKSIRNENADVFVIPSNSLLLGDYEEFFKLAIAAHTDYVLMITKELRVLRLTRQESIHCIWKYRLEKYYDSFQRKLFEYQRKLFNRKSYELCFNNPMLIKDAKFVFRGNPEYPGHDRRGYRNKTTKRKASVLVIGDSQTYGVGVDASETWSHILAEMTKKSIYNGSVGGWGVLHYALALEELLSLSPDRVFVCIYTGNDICESYMYAKISSSHIARSFWNEEYSLLPVVKYGSDSRKILDRMLESSGGLANVPIADALQLGSKEGVPDCNYVEIGNSKYFLQDEEFRFNVQDLSHPTIQAGLAITKKSILHMHQLAGNYGFNLVITLIPTREYLVYKQMNKANVKNTESLMRLGKNEETLLNHLKEYCRSNFIDYFDLSNFLDKHISENIYRQNSDDGHPTALGHEIIAQYIYKAYFENAETDVSSNMYPLY